MIPLRRWVLGAALPWFLLLSAPAAGATKDPQAVEVAQRLMDAMGGQEAFDSLRLLRFDWQVEREGSEPRTFQHWWDRPTGRYRIEGSTRDGKPFRVLFNVSDQQGTVFADGSRVEGEQAAEYLGMAYGRYINDSYWLLMPWKWLDPGVNLSYEGTRDLDGQTYDVVKITFDAGIGLTSSDRYWAFVNRRTGLMDRWEYILQKEDGSPGDGPPTAWRWSDWQDAGGGVMFATRKELIGGEQKFVISFPVARLSAEAPDVVFNPIIRPESTAAPPAQPSGVAPERAGMNQVLVVLNKSDHTASLVGLDDMEVIRTVPTGLGPHEGAVSLDGRTLYVTNYGGSTPGSTLSVIDVPEGTVRRVVDLGEHTRPHGIAVAPDGSVWVTAEGSKSVLRLSAADLSIESVYQTGQETTHMIALSPDGARAYAANIGSGTLTGIDVKSGKVVSVPSGKGSEGIDVSTDGREVWVANREDNTLTIFDARTLKLQKTLPTCVYPIRVKMTRTGDKVLVSCAQSNDLAILDRVLRQELGRIELGSVPIGIQIAPGDEIAFIANTQADLVSLVDIDQIELLGAFYAGREPDGLAWAVWEPPQPESPAPPPAKP